MDLREIRYANLMSLLQSARVDGINNKEWAEKTGMSPAYLSQLVNKVRGLGDTKSREIEDHLKLARGWMDTYRGSLVGSLPPEAAQYQFFPGESSPTDAVMALRRDWLISNGFNPDELSVIQAIGSTMEPQISDGDVMLVEKCEVSKVFNGIYLISTGSAMVPVHLTRSLSRPTVSIVPTNKEYKEEEVQLSELNLIGRVVMVLHNV